MSPRFLSGPDASDLEPPHIHRARSLVMQETATRKLDPLTYSRDDGNSHARDMISVALNLPDAAAAQDRLTMHENDVRSHPAYEAERRSIDATQGAGGYAVVPKWLMDEFVGLARPGRPLAQLCTQLPLPPKTNNIVIPKLTGSATASVQASQNTTPSDGSSSWTDAVINCPVITVSGQLQMAQQLLDLTTWGFDQFVYAELIDAMSAALDTQLLTGTGSNGQLTGLFSTSDVATVSPGISNSNVANDIQSFWDAITYAIKVIGTSRHRQPDVIVMSPVRWAWLTSLSDSSARPLQPPNAGRASDGARCCGWHLRTRPRAWLVWLWCWTGTSPSTPTIAT